MLWYKQLLLPDPVRRVSVSADSLSVKAVAEKISEAEKRGFQRAMDEAENRYNQQILDQRQELLHLQDAVFSGIEEAYRKMEADIAARLPGLIIFLLEKILGGISPDKEMVHSIINAVIGDTNTDEALYTVSLSSHDFNLISEHTRDLQSRYPGIELFEDPSLRPGDCLMKSIYGIIDGRLVTKLKRISEEIEEE